MNDPRNPFQEAILNDAPRLGLDDTLQFRCHPGVSCFNRCCGNVNIFLSPYDVLRLKHRLGMQSREFLERYTLLPVQKDMKTPVVLLRMTGDAQHSCPFLTDQGCGVYRDRPWPCRMYPLGLAARRDTTDGWRGDRFYFLLKEEGCQGFNEPRACTVRQWLDEQGIDEYDEYGEAFKELTLHRFFDDGGVLSPQKLHMFFTACYDLDTFREFVFGSTLLQRFEVDDDLIAEMRTDDETLLRFAFLWLRFSLFGEPTMKPRAAVLDAFKGRLDKRGLFATAGAEVPEEEAP